MVENQSMSEEIQVATLVDLLRKRAVQQPHKIAFTFLKDEETASISLTYQDLDRYAQAIAAQLMSYGVSGERALLLYPPGIEFIAAFFGCLYAGVVAVPAYPPRSNQSISTLQAIVASTQAKVALTNQFLLAKMERLSQNLELAALRWLCTDNLKSESALYWQQPVLSADTLAFLQYTSGSTGKPKGVMVSHGNLLHNLAAIQKSFEHTPNSRGVIWLPPYHDMGLIGGVLQPLYSGFPVTLMSPVAFLSKPLSWLQNISRYKATTSGGPSFAYDLCVRKIKPEQRASLDLSSWEVAFNGAEPVRAEILERFADAFAPYGFRREAFYPCYGMAETTLFICGGFKTRSPTVRKVSKIALSQNRVRRAADEKDTQTIVGLGKSWIDQKIVIVDLEFLTPSPVGQVGEIWVSGSSVAQGYWNRPEETAQTFQAYLANTSVAGQNQGPFLRTGDLGFLESDELFVTGRLKDLIIIRGRNHYPQDIELTVEKSHPALRSCCSAAFSVEVENSERLVVVAEVERSYLRNLDIDEVVGVIRKAVSEQHELQAYVVLLKTGGIPKTSSGKIQRHACRAGFLDKSLDLVRDWSENPQRQINFYLQTEALWHLLPLEQQPFANENLRLKSAPTEEAIQAWMISHLSVYLNVQPHEIDPGETFARYGLDSSVAVSLTSELADWLSYKLEPTLFWEYPSIEVLAHHLAKECQLSHSASQISA